MTKNYRLDPEGFVSAQARTQLKLICPAYKHTKKPHATDAKGATDECVKIPLRTWREALLSVSTLHRLSALLSRSPTIQRFNALTFQRAAVP
jgi:hypothetical protein